jgi:hypothetical protein
MTFPDSNQSQDFVPFIGIFVRRLFTEISRPLTEISRLLIGMSRPLVEVFVEDFSSVASGVGSSVGHLVCKCLILSGQCRQCRVTAESIWDILLQL